MQLTKILKNFLLVAGLACGTANAAVVTLVGSKFDLRYDTGSLGLFGTPTLIGNNIFFVPNAFVAESLNGAGLVSQVSSVSFELIAHAGQQFASAGLTEIGDYKLVGAGSSVSVGGTLTAYDPDAVAATTTVSNMLVSASTPLGIADGKLHNWIAQASLNSAAPSQAWLGTTNSVVLVIENILAAYTDPAQNGAGVEQAFVQKKFAGVALSVNMIPEPASLALIAFASLLLSYTTKQARQRRK